MLELVLEDGTRVAIHADMTIGRAPGSDVRLEDPSVSRRHAQIVVGPGGGEPRLSDAGSSHGTYVDGVRVEGAVPLRDGLRIRLGDRVLEVERPRAASEAGRTIVVPIGASLLVPAIGEATLEAAAGQRTGLRPRLRSGHRMKRLAASEGGGRWVIEDLRTGRLLRLDDADGSLLELFDGRASVAELVAQAEARLGPEGPGRLARLLADLGERGLLAGIAGTGTPTVEPAGWRRLVVPREWTSPRLGPWFARLYDAGGWLLFTRPALVLLATVAVAGLVAEALLIGLRYGSPFVVASKLGLGGLVFLVARGLLVAVHETAHGLALASFGRRVTRAGIKVIVVFPYAFVDTSEAWFEPRRHRIIVSLAGPASDLVLAGTFAIACLVLPAGTVRDILFQAAFAGYIGAFFNLNPFLDRDGYHVLVDVLGRPRLRERARTEFARRLSGQGAADHDPALRRYAIAGLVWSVVAAVFVIALTLRYLPVMQSLAPDAVVWGVLGTLYAALFVPVFLTLGPPLVQRLRGRAAP